jgi:putative ABC transport system ATP-binding protein
MIKIEEVRKVYQLGGSNVEALRGVSFRVDAGEFVTIQGPSGSGKSTLLNILGCLDRPTSGRYVIEGTEAGDLDDDALACLRNQKIGFVFQTFNLLPRLTALKNVELPLLYGGVPRRERRERALAVIGAVGLLPRGAHRPRELSGGEQQRVAIARAMVNRPAILLADEPTGNLDSQAAEEILDLFDTLNRSGTTVIVVTHNPKVAERARRILCLQDGLLPKDEVVQRPKAEAKADVQPHGAI